MARRPASPNRLIFAFSAGLALAAGLSAVFWTPAPPPPLPPPLPVRPAPVDRGPLDEVLRLLRARQARSAATVGQGSGGNVMWRARIAGHMAGQLFLRSYERSDRIYNEMLSRGFKGELMTIHPHHFHASDLWIGALSILSLLIMQIAGRL